LQHCVNAVLRNEAHDVLNLGPSDGYAPLKLALLEMLGREGIAAKDENLLVTDGCQQSLDLISKAFVRPGDSVILENPTYPGAVAIFHGARARCLAVPVKTQAEPGSELGVDVEALEATLAANRVKLIILTPDFHNPTGTSMSLASRRRVLELAARHQVPIVEDHIYGRLHLREERVPSLKQLDRANHRQFCEGGVSGVACWMDCGSGCGCGAAEAGEADDRSAYRSTGTSHAGGIYAARAFYEASGEDAEGLFGAAGGAGSGAAEAHAGRDALDASRRRDVFVAGVASGV
jgi:aspartate/methionine/tyrosine aminotransferase